MQSDQINEIAAALAKAQSAMKAATYNKINPHFKNKYADLSSVIDALRKPLADNGLSVSQTTEMPTAEMLVLRTILLHTSGQWLSCVYPLPIADNPQQLGSALTYARRYSLSCIVCIAADDDDDAETATAKGGPITADQETQLIDLCEAVGADRKKFCTYLGVDSLADLSSSRFTEAMLALEAKRKKK